MAGALVAAGTTVAVAAAGYVGTPGGRSLVWAAVVGLAAGAGTALATYGASRVGGAAALAFVHPSGATCPAPPQYSRIDALAAAGRVDEALAAFGALAAAEPGNVAVRLHAAELAIRSRLVPELAARWLREVQRAPEATSDDDVRASQRLVDLYLGPLADRGRALRELRRLADRYPMTPAGASARDALRRVKNAGV